MQLNKQTKGMPKQASLFYIYFGAT